MKLLYCPECADLFSLSATKKSCSCGSCGGRYLIDGKTVECWGCGVPVGIDNASFDSAMFRQRGADRRGEAIDGSLFEAWIIPGSSPTMKKTSAPKDAE